MLPDLVIFDFAGTMLRDDGVVLAAYRRALTANDIPFTEADLAARRGAAKWAVFRELAGRPTRSTATDQLAERALANFESALREEYTRGEVASIEGAESSARWLAERGAKIALSSGFDRGLVELLVERLGWEKLFDRVLAAEDAPAGAISHLPRDDRPRRTRPRPRRRGRRHPARPRRAATPERAG